jgi:hypothetical protein
MAEPAEKLSSQLPWVQLSAAGQVLVGQVGNSTAWHFYYFDQYRRDIANDPAPGF